MRNDATAQKDLASGGANRLPGFVATLARFSDSENQASRFTPRLPGKPICLYQIDSIWSDSALTKSYFFCSARFIRGATTPMVVFKRSARDGTLEAKELRA